MTTVVIMPGGFHPFHAGHAALYNSIRKAFPGAEVYVAATNDTSTRPFPFAVKEKLAKLAGVEPGHFVQVKSPFRAEEITSQFDPATDQLIFVRSEKDEGKPPVPGGVKKDGSPAYLQPFAGAKKLAPFSQHAYMAYLPTVEFGPGMTSATEIRTAWPQLDDRRKTALVMSLYPKAQTNPKLAATVVKLLDTAILSEEVLSPIEEVFDTPATRGAWDNAPKWMGMDKFTFTASNGVPYRVDFLDPGIGPEEMGPESFEFHLGLDDAVFDKILDRAKFVEFEQVNTKDPNASGKQGIEGTGAAAEVFGIVVNAILTYIKTNKPSMLYFQAVEPNRRRLYTSMVNRLLKSLPGWGFERSGPADSMFAIYNTRLLKGKRMEEGNEKHYSGWEEFDEDRTAQILEFLRELRPELFSKFGQGYLEKVANNVFRAAPKKSLTQLAGDVIRSIQQNMAENQGWAATYEDDMQIAGTPAVGGMWAGYQQRENQPVAEDYIEERRA